MWTETRNPSEVWTASFSFRATGPERGGGNLELWYTAEGQDSIGTSSIYTVGKFDGLAITLDTHGGSAGMIRGFLNDGSIEYNKHHSVDALAFGHCQYAYRNLGRPSVLVIQQETTVFSVEIDGKSCFRSSEIKLPKDYFFGLSAASAETPDSFEAFGFKVTHDSTQFSHSNQQQPPAHQFTNPQGSSGVPAEAPASQYKTSEAQFADLHDRIQALSTQLSLLQGTFAEAVYKMGEGHEEVIRVAREPGSQFSSLETKVGNIERTLYKVQADVEGKDYRGHLDEIHNAVREGHTSLMEGLPASMSESKSCCIDASLHTRR
jgi:mannose-binding lectin 1